MSQKTLGGTLCHHHPLFPHPPGQQHHVLLVNSSGGAANSMLTSDSSSSGDGPQYAEIYGNADNDEDEGLMNKPGVNPYATTGIFISDFNTQQPHYHHTSARHHPVILNPHHHHQHHQTPHLGSVRIVAAPDSIQQQQTMAKYFLSSQSQSNTPKLLVKNTLHNKVRKKFIKWFP
jgi:hypothetical protein